MRSRSLGASVAALVATSLSHPAVAQQSETVVQPFGGESVFVMRLGGLEQFANKGASSSSEGARVRALASALVTDLKVSSIAKTRVNLDFAEVPLSVAIRRVLSMGSMPYRISDDIPSDHKVTLSLPNVRIGTAMDLLTQAGEIGWRMELLDGKLAIRVGKSVQPIESLGMMLALSEERAPSGANLVMGSQLGHSGGLLGFRTRLTEYRTTFRCQHCSAQASVLSESWSNRCSALRHTMNAEWKLCPYDGSGRVPSAPNWRYCPRCGKRITPSRSVPSAMTETPGQPLSSKTRTKVAQAYAQSRSSCLSQTRETTRTTASGTAAKSR